MNAERRRLMGMPLDGVTLEDATERIRVASREGRGGGVLTPNLDILRQFQRSPVLREVFEQTELLVPDGVPLVWASSIQGTPVAQRITGTDMLWAVTELAAQRGALLFLAGGRPGVPERAAGHLAARHPGLRPPPSPAS